MKPPRRATSWRQQLAVAAAACAAAGAGASGGCVLRGGEGAPLRVDAVLPTWLPATDGGRITIDGLFAPAAVLDVSRRPSSTSDVFLAWLGDGAVELADVARISDTRLEATVPSGAPSGRWDLTVETPDGRSATLAGALTLTPPDGAVLAITRVDAAASTVYAGQQGVVVVVTVANPGQAAATISEVSLRMTAGGSDRTADYAATPQPGNPGSVVAGGEAVWAFSVDVGAEAAPEAVAVDASAAGEDAQSGALLADDAAALPDAWTVAPAPLVVLQVISGVMTVMAGQADVPAQVSLRNASPTDTVRLEAVELVLGGSGFFPEQLSPVLPFDLLPGAMINVTFAVDVSASAAPGVVALDARAVGSVPPGGVTVVVEGAEATDQWIVN